MPEITKPATRVIIEDFATEIRALAQALTHDYDRFETLIEGGEVSE